MSILSVTRKFVSSGSVDYESKRNTYQETWQVIFSENHGVGPNENWPPYATEVLAAPGLPQRGDVYGKGTAFEDTSSFAYGFDPQMSERQPRHWLVEIAWRSPSPQSIDPDRDDIFPPTDRPVKRSLRYTRTERPLTRDRITKDPNLAAVTAALGLPANSIQPPDIRWYKPIVNANGRPFMTPPSFQEVHRVYRFQKYLDAFPSAAFDPYIDSINNAEYMGFPARTLKCITVDPEEEFFTDPILPQEQRAYWHTLFEFEYSPTPWNPTETLAEDVYEVEYKTVLDASPDNVYVPTGKLRQIKDVAGNEITEPWPLDSLGRAVDPALILKAGNSSYTFTDPWNGKQYTVPHFIRANRHKEIDFTFFNPYLDL